MDEYYYNDLATDVFVEKDSMKEGQDCSYAIGPPDIFDMPPFLRKHVGRNQTMGMTYTFL